MKFKENDIPNVYDCAIIGGGLAGLCLAIQLAKNGHKIILFEKNQYPFHKVCGASGYNPGSGDGAARSPK